MESKNTTDIVPYPDVLVKRYFGLAISLNMLKVYEPFVGQTNCPGMKVIDKFFACISS